MALYEYRCPTCETHFELRRPMSESSSAATCPEGHTGAVRLLSVFASVSSSAGGVGAASSPGPGGGFGAGAGMSCGSACACH